MKKIIPFIFIVLVCISCKKELVKEPKNRISKEKMVAIMYDLSLIEGMKIQDPTLTDSLRITSNQYIFKKYKIDSIQFASSNSYYASDYEAYEKMYTEVKNRIENQKAAINAKIKANAKKEEAKAKAKKKQKLKREADSLQKIKQELKFKREKDSIHKITTKKSKD